LTSGAYYNLKLMRKTVFEWNASGREVSGGGAGREVSGEGGGRDVGGGGMAL
jgi:hypothetical protein